MLYVPQSAQSQIRSIRSTGACQPQLPHRPVLVRFSTVTTIFFSFSTYPLGGGFSFSLTTESGLCQELAWLRTLMG